MCDYGPNMGVILVVTRSLDESRWAIAMTITMNHDPHIEDPAYSSVVVILPDYISDVG